MKIDKRKIINKLNNFVEFNLNNKIYKIKVVFSSKSKNIKLSINKQHVMKISAPSYVSTHDIYFFLNSNKNKIIEIVDRLPQSLFFDLSNNFICILGKKYNLEYVCGNVERSKYKIYDEKIVIYLKEKNNKSVESVIKRLLKNQSEKYILDRAKIISNKLGYNVLSFSIKWMTGCWGNCYKKLSKISYSSRLIVFPIEVIDYVIVHELCHLVHANHSTQFWNLVSSYIPNYKKCKQILKKF